MSIRQVVRDWLIFHKYSAIRSHDYLYQERRPLLQCSTFKDIFKITYITVLRIMSKKNENKMGRGKGTIY